jgi:hypothetical protein
MKKTYAALLTGILTVFLTIAWNNPDEASDYRSKSFSVQNDGLLTVEVEPGAIYIESWSNKQVLVEAEGIDEHHPERLEVSQSGNNVTVKYRDTRHRTNNLRFKIKVPSSYNADVKTSGGSVKQRHILNGYFKAETKGGSIDIDEVTGTVNVDTKGGSIEANKFGGDASLETGGGSIEVKSALASLKLETRGGSIEVGDVKGKTQARTGGGSISIGNAGEYLELETGGGSIKIRGADKGVSIKTGGGSIDLENIHRSVSAKTGGGSISVTLIPDASGNSTITTGGGEISLSIPENSKATIEATIKIHGLHKCKIHSDFKADSDTGNSENDDIYKVYTLNGGGHKIVLKTSGSDISIRKLTGAGNKN